MFFAIRNGTEHRSQPIRVIFAVILGFLTAGPVFAEEAYQVGDELPSVEFVDQHGRPGSIDRSTRRVLLVRDKFASEILKEAFVGLDPNALEERKVAYVTDISELSLMAANLFVVPGMRLKEYSILLDRAPRKTSRYPVRGGLVTVLFLDGLRIDRIEYASTGDEVSRWLDLPAAPSSTADD